MARELFWSDARCARGSVREKEPWELLDGARELERRALRARRARLYLRGGALAAGRWLVSCWRCSSYVARGLLCCNSSGCCAATRKAAVLQLVRLLCCSSQAPPREQSRARSARRSKTARGLLCCSSQIARRLLASSS